MGAELSHPIRDENLPVRFANHNLGEDLQFY